MILFLNFYIDKKPLRQLELEYCLDQNIKNPLLELIVIMYHDDGKTYSFLQRLLRDRDKAIILESVSSRPSYNEIFSLMADYSDLQLHILANSDIYFNETLQHVANFDWTGNPKTCIALSRWDEDKDGNIILWDHADSQDVWIFYGSPKLIPGADFTMGMAGCDNKIAWLLEQQGYNVINPSKTIQAVHLHNSSQLRNYNADEDRKKVLPPFKLIHPHD